MRELGLILACIATVVSPSLASAQQRRRTAPRPSLPRASPPPEPVAAATPAPIQAPTVPVVPAPSPAVTPSQPAAEPEGRYVHFGLTGMLGYGVVGRMGGNIGGRVAFTFGASTPRFYIGGAASYHTGTTESYNNGFDGNATYRRDYSYAGGDIGFEIVWRMLHFRPYATLGALWVTQQCSGARCFPFESYDRRAVTLGVGFNPYVTAGLAVFGIDARVIADNNGDPILPTLSLSATFGFVIQ